MTEVKPSTSRSGRKNKPAGNEALSSVIRLSDIPYGFFEKELKGYFAQFGRIKRVRVVRNKKVCGCSPSHFCDRESAVLLASLLYSATHAAFQGNHTGIAFVQFGKVEVAEIAAETMDNYILAEKRIRCKVLKVTDLPKSVQSGGLYLRVPKKNANRIRDSKKRFAEKTEEQEIRQRVCC